MTRIPQISMSVGATVLVGGKLLSGTELSDYAKHKGLCPKCVQHKTHKRIKKRLGILRSEADWEPITEKDKEAGNYIVYKGYCLQPTCWTLSEAKGMLGETPTLRSKSSTRSRMVTPGRERPSSASADDCGSVAHSEITFRYDPPSRYIGTTSSNRTLSAGRGITESRMDPSFPRSETVCRPKSASRSIRQSTGYSLREIESGGESSQSRTSDSTSTHSRDTSLLGRQSSASSIISDVSDRSSHRRRMNRKLLEVKFHESPREVRPAMFYRQPTDSSESSDNESDKMMEQIDKTDNQPEDCAASRSEQTLSTSSQRRASIGNFIQSSPRLLNNLLLDSRAVAVSNRELRNCESTVEHKENEEEKFRISPESSSEIPVPMNEVKTSPTEDDYIHSRRSRFPYGKGKSSSHIHSQQKVSAALKRSSLSYVTPLRNHQESRYSESSKPSNTSKGQITPENAIKIPHQSRYTRSNVLQGIRDVCLSPKIGTASNLSVVSPSSTSCQGMKKRNGDIRSPVSDVSDTINRSTGSYTTDGHVSSRTEKSNINHQRGASTSFVAQTSAVSSPIQCDFSARDLTNRHENSQKMSDCTADEKLQEEPQISTGSISHAPLPSVNVLAIAIKLSPQVTFPTHEISNRRQETNGFTIEGNDRHKQENSSIISRRRASMSFVSQPSVKLIRTEKSPQGISSTCNKETLNQDRGKTKDSKTEECERSCHEISHQKSRQRASISNISQSLGDELTPQAIPSIRGYGQHRSIGKIKDIYHERLSDGGISNTSPALLYKRYSQNDISDDDNVDDASLYHSVNIVCKAMQDLC